jgi:hypothetical protein
MKPPRTLKEALLAVGLLAFGLLCLPALIYVVGQRLVGAYPNGLAGLYEAIADALLTGNGFAWTLILSPLLVVQLSRLWLWLRRRRPGVT